MGIKAACLSVAGLLITGGVLAGAAGAQAAPPPRADDVTAEPAARSVTAAERGRVVAAVQQRDEEVAVHAVRRGTDGTFHVFGSKAGEPVLAEVNEQHVRVSPQQRAVA